MSTSNVDINTLFKKIEKLSSEKVFRGVKIHGCDEKEQYHELTIAYTNTHTTTIKDLIKNKQIFTIYAIDINSIKDSIHSLHRKRLFALLNLLTSNGSSQEIIDLLDCGLPTVTIEFRFPKETAFSSSSSFPLQIVTFYNNLTTFRQKNPKIFSSWTEHMNFPGNICEIETMKLLTQFLGKEFLDVAFSGYNYNVEFYYNINNQEAEKQFKQNSKDFYKTFKDDLLEYEIKKENDDLLE